MSSNEKENDKIVVNDHDSGVIINGKTCEVGVFFPKIAEESQEITPELSQAMFLASYLAYALQQDEWIDTYAKYFTEQKMNNLNDYMSSISTDEEEEFLKQLMINNQFNLSEDSDNDEDKEINFEKELLKLKEQYNKPQ
jgi:hypothetical protein